jgi:hypothetical protein
VITDDEGVHTCDNLYICIMYYCSILDMLVIICFKIKNTPTLHSTSKIQPTTSPTFVFSVFKSVRKTWGYEIKLLTAVLVVVHRVF